MEPDIINDLISHPLEYYHDDLLGNIQISSLWLRTFSTDKNIAEERWLQLRKNAKGRYDSYDKRLNKIQEDIKMEDSEVCLDLNYLEQKKENVDIVLLQIDKFDVDYADVSKLFEQLCQFMPKGFYRHKIDSMMRSLHVKYYEILQELQRKKEVLYWIIPKFHTFITTGAELKPWLDAIEPRVDPYKKFFSMSTITDMLDNKHVIEEIANEIYEKKHTIDSFMCAGKGILAIQSDMKFDSLRDDIDHVSRRWDYLCGNIESCLNRILYEEQLKLLELEKRTDQEKIDTKLKHESMLCTCSSMFKMVKVGEGRYTFGTTKAVRLLRIHGNSIVVRVGGGWEYLYDFLVKVDPCRARQFAEHPEHAVQTIKNLTGISLVPTDEASSYTMSVQRLHKSSYIPFQRLKNSYRTKGQERLVDQRRHRVYDSLEFRQRHLSEGDDKPKKKKSESEEQTESPVADCCVKNDEETKEAEEAKNTVADTTTTKSKKKTNLSRRMSLVERQAKYKQEKKVRPHSVIAFLTS